MIGLGVALLLLGVVVLGYKGFVGAQLRRQQALARQAQVKLDIETKKIEKETQELENE